MLPKAEPFPGLFVVAWVGGGGRLALTPLPPSLLGKGERDSLRRSLLWGNRRGDLRSPTPVTDNDSNQMGTKRSRLCLGRTPSYQFLLGALNHGPTYYAGGCIYG